jgi:hypothetical protein
MVQDRQCPQSSVRSKPFNRVLDPLATHFPTDNGRSIDIEKPKPPRSAKAKTKTISNYITNRQNSTARMPVTFLPPRISTLWAVHERMKEKQKERKKHDSQAAVPVP